MSASGNRSDRPTIYDVADKAGVSTFTVSRVINESGFVRHETRARVEEAISQLGFVPSAAARRLRSRRSDVISLVISDVTNPFWAQVIEAVQGFFTEKGISVLLGNTRSDPAEEDRQIEMALAQSVDGIIITPLADASLERVAKIRDRGVPCVVLDRRATHGVDVVRGESRAGAFELTKLLIDRGHRRIGLVTGGRDRSTAVDRYEGYREAIEQAGLTLDVGLVRWGPYTHGFGAEAASCLLDLDPPPTAIFAANNSLAEGVLDALRSRQIAVPQDVAVVGFDAIPTLASFLTVAEQPASEMGRKAAEMLYERIDGFAGPPRELVLDAEIKIRTSSGGSLASPQAKSTM